MRRCRKARLQPPGAPKAPRKAGPAAAGAPKRSAAERQLQAAAALAALDAPTLRQSTRQRTEDAERERLEQVQNLSQLLEDACTSLPQGQLSRRCDSSACGVTALLLRLHVTSVPRSSSTYVSILLTIDHRQALRISCSAPRTTLSTSTYLCWKVTVACPGPS